VTAVADRGLDAVDDQAHVVMVPRSFVEGRRTDGSPNCSHAWARTVDGVQGGTWTQVHLLGTAALERFTGYVGQSRSRRPTHTWNVAPIPTTDVCGVLADQRDAAHAVLEGLQRVPDTGFAIHDTTLPREFKPLIRPPAAVSLALSSKPNRLKRAEPTHAMRLRSDEAVSRLRSDRARRDVEPGIDIEL
jgi:hypothetical protein